VNRNAFEKENEAGLVENIRSSNEFIPELSLVALINDKIVGHIPFSPIIINPKKLYPL
jgi:putative acetyltransferase